MKRTLTVEELIAELERFDGQTPVIWHGGTDPYQAVYGALSPDDANAVCVIATGGKMPERDRVIMASLPEGEYAEAVGAI